MIAEQRESYWTRMGRDDGSYQALASDARCSVLIVGGGITGAMAAYRMATEGYDTILIEENEIGSGSTCDSTSILQYELDQPLYRLSAQIGPKAAGEIYRYGIQAIDELCDLVHAQHMSVGFQMKNSVFFAKEPDDLAMLEEEFTARRQAGLPVHWLSRSDLRRNYRLDGHGAILSEKAAVVDSVRLTRQLIEKALLTNHFRVYTQTTMREVIYGGRYKSVITSEGNEIKCDRIVYATGYSTLNFFREPVADLVTTFACVTEPQHVISPAISTTVFWDTGKPYTYLRTTEDNRLMIGGGDTTVRNSDEQVASKEVELMRRLAQIFPELKLNPHYTWSAVFATTRDSMPFIGQHPDHENSFFVLGYGGNGITFSLMASRMLCDQQRGRPNVFLEYFRFGR